MHVVIFSILLVISLTNVTSIQFDYYWKDYYGEIPDDALPGGRDRSRNITYIAQLFVILHGILPTRLYEGEKTVTASRYGTHTSDQSVKILCTNHPEKFSWLSTTASTLHSDIKGKHMVVGGTENGKLLNIGRVPYQGEVIVGKVCGYNIGHAQMLFPYKGSEVQVGSYEILLYDEDAPPIFDLRLKKSGDNKKK